MANREGRLLPGAPEPAADRVRPLRAREASLPTRNPKVANREGRLLPRAPVPVADRVRLHREKKEGQRRLVRRQEKQVNLLSRGPQAVRQRGRRTKGRNPRAALPAAVFQLHQNLLLQHCRRPNRLAFRPSAKLLPFRV